VPAPPRARLRETNLNLRCYRLGTEQHKCRKNDNRAMHARSALKPKTVLTQRFPRHSQRALEEMPNIDLTALTAAARMGLAEDRFPKAPRLAPVKNPQTSPAIRQALSVVGDRLVLIE
jgi:hypothetical protein